MTDFQIGTFLHGILTIVEISREDFHEFIEDAIKSGVIEMSATGKELHRIGGLKSKADHGPFERDQNTEKWFVRHGITTPLMAFLVQGRRGGDLRKLKDSASGCCCQSPESDRVHHVQEPADEPISTIRPGDQWGGKLCKCTRCGITTICRSCFDFYVIPDDVADPDGAPLYCLSCSLIVTKEKARDKASGTKYLPH